MVDIKKISHTQDGITKKVWELQSDFSASYKGVSILIRKGFRFDGATQFLVGGLIGIQPTGIISRAALIHDAIFSWNDGNHKDVFIYGEVGKVDLEFANDWMRYEMRNMDWFRRNAVFFFISIFGRFFW